MSKPFCSGINCWTIYSFTNLFMITTKLLCLKLFASNGTPSQLTELLLVIICSPRISFTGFLQLQFRSREKWASLGREDSNRCCTSQYNLEFEIGRTYQVLQVRMSHFSPLDNLYYLYHSESSFTLHQSNSFPEGKGLLHPTMAWFSSASTFRVSNSQN